MAGLPAEPVFLGQPPICDPGADHRAEEVGALSTPAAADPKGIRPCASGSAATRARSDWWTSGCSRSPATTKVERPAPAKPVGTRNPSSSRPIRRNARSDIARAAVRIAGRTPPAPSAPRVRPHEGVGLVARVTGAVPATPTTAPGARPGHRWRPGRRWRAAARPSRPGYRLGRPGQAETDRPLRAAIMPPPRRAASRRAGSGRRRRARPGRGRPRAPADWSRSPRAPGRRAVPSGPPRRRSAAGRPR